MRARSQTIQLSTDSIARAATLNVTSFKFSPAAQHLTPELTRREASDQAFNLADERPAQSGRVE
jgi:hypothetical protein